MSNCRAASRVRQYPAAYTVSTAAQLAATKLFEIRPLPLRLGMAFIVRGEQRPGGAQSCRCCQAEKPAVPSIGRYGCSRAQRRA
jgi:hypothetical protein